MNYHNILFMNYKVCKIYLFTTILFLIGVTLILSLDIYDSYNAIGYIKNNQVIIDVKIPYPETMLHYDYIKIGDNNYYESNIILDELNNSGYQKIYINVSTRFIENEYLPVTMYYNKERIIDKIKKSLL